MDGDIELTLAILGVRDARVERYHHELGEIKNPYVNFRAQPIQTDAEYCVIATDKADKAVGGMQILELGRGQIYIIQTVVAEELRGRRLSAAMMSYLEKHLKGFDKITSQIDADNASSIKSRKEMGFEIAPKNLCDTHKATKEIDPKIATKRLCDAEPETIILHARKGAYAPAVKPEGERERWV